MGIYIEFTSLRTGGHLPVRPTLLHVQFISKLLKTLLPFVLLLWE